MVYWNIKKVEDEEEKDADGNPKQKTIPILRYYNVFHISQVDGVVPLTSSDPHEHEPIADGENLLHGYVDASGVNFEETLNNRAYYAPATDSVVVPDKSQFNRIEEFYSTAFHELVHSTGHVSRLDRFNGTQVAAFGSGEYSKEELVAEIGAASILNRLGIETDKSFRNSAAYIQSWLQVLKNDSRFIVSAAGKAEKAVKLIYGEE